MKISLLLLRFTNLWMSIIYCVQNAFSKGKLSISHKIWYTQFWKFRAPALLVLENLSLVLFIFNYVYGTDIVDFWWPPEANNGSNWRNQRFQNACSSVFFVEDVFTYGVDFQGRGVACSATLGIIIICDIPQYVITLQAVPCCFHDSIFHILF